MTLATNGHTPSSSQPARAADGPALTQAGLVTLSALLQRSLLAGSLGQQFAGDRDMYEVLGYKLALSFDDYLGKYKRQDLAGRVVDLPAIDTWRYSPTFSDGDSEDTPFMEDWKTLATRLPMWRAMRQVDRLAGIGRYGVLLLGLRDGATLDQPVARALTGPADVLYVRALTEKSADIGTLDKDQQSERYGLPLTYNVSLAEGMGAQVVHWQRIIHVAEDTMEDDVYGTPRLERVFDRLDDLMKIVGGGAEATWKVMDRGLHADVRDGFSLGPEDQTALSDEIDEYIHGLRRFVRTSGVDLKQLGSDVVDPSGLFGVIISLIAAAANIPQRILIGSERGELASSQDAGTWAGVIGSRQTGFAEPVIVRPLLGRLIDHGALRPTTSGKVTIAWRSLLDQDEGQQSEIAQRKAAALTSYASTPAAQQIVPPGEFREQWLDLPADVPKEYKIPEPAPVVVAVPVTEPEPADEVTE